MTKEQAVELYMATSELYSKAVDFLVYEAGREDKDDNIITNLKAMIVSINNILATLHMKIREAPVDGNEKQG